MQDIRSIVLEDLKYLASGELDDVNVAMYRFSRRECDEPGQNGPGVLVGGNYSQDGGMESVAARLCLPHVIGMDDAGLAWVIRYAGDPEMIASSVLAAREAMLADLARIIDFNVPSGRPMVGVYYLPWDNEAIFTQFVVVNAGKGLTENRILFEAQLLEALATIGVNFTAAEVTMRVEHATRLSVLG